MVQIESNVAAVYEDVRNDKTPTNWLLLGYADEKGETLKLVKTGMRIDWANRFDPVDNALSGTGGLEEFKKQLVDKEAYFGYVRMVVGNDELVSKPLLASYLPHLRIFSISSRTTLSLDAPNFF